MTEREIFNGVIVSGSSDFALVVAALPDLVAAKIDAWSEPRRRPNKRRKDELDLLRLAEAHPDVVDALLPIPLLGRAQLDREQIRRHPDGDGWGGES